MLIVFSNLFIACNHWSSDTQIALKLAGENKKELEKVLIYYSKNESDSLKLKAAEYLISNMIYQYSITGSEVNNANAKYKLVYRAERGNRNKLFNSDSLKKIGDKEYKFDLQNISSQFIINQIESAFRIYKYDWCKSYSFKMFCEYILPYKFTRSANVDWRNYANKKFFPMFNLMSFTGDSSVYEAESFTKKAAFIENIANASEGKVFHLYKKRQNELKLPFKTKLKGYQKFVVHYLNGSLSGSNIRITIDNKRVGDFIFPSTGTWKEIDNSLSTIDFDVNLGYGNHVLKMESMDADLFIDFLELPESISLDKSVTLIKDGVYFLKNPAGWLTFQNDSLTNSTRPILNDDFSKATPFQIYSDGLFYQISIQDKSITKVIDAYTKKNSNYVSLYENFSANNQKWGIIRNKNGDYQIRNKATNKFLSSEKDNIIIQSPEQTINSGWYFKINKNAVPNNGIDPAIKAAMRVTEITNRFHWFGEGNMAGLINSKSLIDFSYGSCPLETQYQTMVLRSLGVASTIDFIFNWGNRYSGHEWSVVFDSKGKPIQNNCHNPVGAVIWNSHFKKGKIYRKTNTINRSSLFIKNNGKEAIPYIFNNPYFSDVTEEYCESHDASISISKNTEAKNKFGYILVHNNIDWTPIGWGERIGSNFLFKKLEKNIVYLPAQFNGVDFEVFNSPFFIDSLGRIQRIVYNSKAVETISISRKYPYYKADDLLDKQIIGGKFQGSNKPDFTDAVTIGVITDSMTNPIFNTIIPNVSKKFRFFRYVGSKNSFCSINEIAVYNRNGDQIKGEQIGSVNSSNKDGKAIEKAFDNDVLTSYESTNAIGDWIGLAFQRPTSIGKIRFVGRNDGNMIEIGDQYELFFWDNTWKSLGRKKSSSDTLVYQNVPVGALLLLHNLRKGYEERPFTIKNGKQVWW